MPEHNKQAEIEYLKQLTLKIKYYKNQNLHKMQYNLIMQYFQTHSVSAELTNRNQILSQFITCAEKMKDYEKLIIAYQYVIKLNPPQLNQFKINFSFVETLIEAEKYQKAKDRIQMVLNKFDKNNLDLIKAYVRSCSKLGQFQDGLDYIQNYEMRIASKTWNSTLCHWKILLFYHMGKYDQALVQCDQGVKQQLKQKQIFLQKKCHILILSNQFTQSLELSKALLSSKKLTGQKNQQIGALLSYCFLKQQKYEQSKLAIKTATEINPESHMGVLKQCILLKLNPKQNMSLYKFRTNIGIVLKQMKRCEELKEKKAEIAKYFFNLNHLSVYLVHLQYFYDNISIFWENSCYLQPYLELLFLSVLEGYEGSTKISLKLDSIRQSMEMQTKQQQETSTTIQFNKEQEMANCK